MFEPSVNSLVDLGEETRVLHSALPVHFSTIPRTCVYHQPSDAWAPAVRGIEVGSCRRLNSTPNQPIRFTGT